MRATIYSESGTIALGERPDPVIREPTDAIVRVTMSCVCGSDLEYYRGDREHAIGSIGHEAIGVVEDVGSEVAALRPGDFVIVPLQYSDGSCVHCRNGTPFACTAGSTFGNGTSDGGQGEAMRIPFAAATLHPVPGSEYSDELLRSLLTLSDVMCTGHHAAVSANVTSGSVVAVVGDGAVGLCALLAAVRLGAERIIALSSNPVRQQLALEFGATDIVAERGDLATTMVLELTGGVGVGASLECVGSPQAVTTAFEIARPGAMVGFVGIGKDPVVPAAASFWRNVGWRGGPTQTPIYIPELLPDVLGGRINPGRVFDWETDLSGIVDAYDAMNDRRAIKSLVRVSAP